jgi:hypothetical protein
MEWAYAMGRDTKALRSPIEKIEGKHNECESNDETLKALEVGEHRHLQ